MNRHLLWVWILVLLAGCGVRYYPTPPEPPEENGEAALAGSGGINDQRHLGKPHVILISFDGFRYDYFDRTDTPAFDRVMEQGVRAEALIPVFPTKTFPNHYTIATGMYPAAHGIVSNTFYDADRNAQYSIGDRESVMDGSWYRGEPLWVTAETQGMVAASYFWVGSEADVRGVRPTTWQPYDGRVPYEVRVDSVLAWLSLPPEHRPHMITLYFSRVDSAGHRHGPDSEEVDEAIRHVDAALGRLLDGLEGRDDVYLVMVSDHGMADYWPETAVAIDDIIDMEGVRMPDSGPAAFLHIDGGSARAVAVRDQLNANIENGRAYLIEEAPGHLGLSPNLRLGQVVVVMDEHWQIRPGDRLPRSPGGTHGWDPALPSMHGIFLAMGPGIDGGRVVPAVKAVHVYRLIAGILGLEPYESAENDGGALTSRLLGG